VVGAGVNVPVPLVVHMPVVLVPAMFPERATLEAFEHKVWAELTAIVDNCEIVIFTESVTTGHGLLFVEERENVTKPASMSLLVIE
jgi:hypothetical protein